MSLYDYFGYSIAGMRTAQGILDTCAAYLAKPENWYGPPAAAKTSSSSSGATFQEYLANAMNERGGEGPGNGGTGNPGQAVPRGYAPVDDLRAGVPWAPQSIMDAIIYAMIAARMYEANARIFAIQNKVVGILINIGK